MPQRSFRIVLVPNADSENEAGIVDDSTFFARKPGRVAECLRVGESDIRGELAADLVADAQAGIELRKSRTDAPAGIAFAIEIHFDLRLRNQPIGDQQLIGCVYPAGESPPV